MKNQAIGELSSKTGVHIETIRYYEREGILPTPMRSPAGRRIYSDEDVRRLNFIHKCRGLGFSLKEINSLLSLVDSGDFTCKEVHELTIHHAGQITEKIVDLKKMEGVLQAMAAQCNQGNVPQCPIIDSLFDA
ncbi:MAG: helix-turn-helix domain-containing protein [Proteobacteria bacterium]|nr:helix-turn-helix domain-containing protein [Pseudomonadota bacterium]MCH8174732.1 helix-turn-helix domain-containing protein [Pseudomonadota bacterium]